MCFEWRDLCLCEQGVCDRDEVVEINSGRQELVLLQHSGILNKAVVIVCGHGKKSTNPILVQQSIQPPDYKSFLGVLHCVLAGLSDD